MYKVLIVDDEQPVLDGLQFIIKKNFDQLAIAATARSGREAIEQAKLVHPDIVLMDVKMPGLSGLDAVREIRQHQPRAIFILVTAYERFEVAKEAFDLGVVEYLLKPVSKERLLSILQNAIAKLDERHGFARREVQARETLDSVVPYLEQALASLVCHSDPLLTDLRFLRETLVFKSSYARIVCVEFVTEDPRYDWEAFFLEFRTSLKYKCSVAIGALRGRSVVLVFPQENLADTPWHYLAAVPLPEVVRMKCGIGGAREWETLGRSFQEAQSALSRSAVGVLQIFEPGSADVRLYPFALEDSLVRAIQTGDSELARALFQQLRRQIQSLFASDDEAYRESLIALGISVSHQCARGGPEDRDWWEWTKVDEVGRLESLLETRLTALCSLAAPASGYSQILERALDYIKQNFTSPLSLDDVAARVGVNPQYLSRIFSEEKKESFIDFLTRIRIKKAREMLLDGLHVKDVSQSLGFSDPNYFSRLFKKWEGQTPMEFARNRKSENPLPL